jgi:uncharacterized protein YgbK (DUF1537 family)
LNAKNKSMIIIADDLTGANDTGVQFANQGLHTEVLLEGTALTAIHENMIIVVDTNSRAIPAAEAYIRVQRIAEQAHCAGFKHYYKKLDSTLRGNVGTELQAILDLKLHDFALVMPAYPKNGRTTVGGHHLIQGIPLSTTEIAKDPKCPVLETVLPELLRQQTTALIGHIGINELSQGKAAIVATIRRYLSEGRTIISCDAWLDEHFQLAAQAALQVSDHVLWAGSAALAECLPQLFNWCEAPHQCHSPTLVIAGSVSTVTRGQVEQLLVDGYELVEIAVANYLPWQENQPLPCLEKALSLLAAGKRVVLTSGYHTDEIARAQKIGATLGMSTLEVSETVACILGFMGAAILRQQEVTGIILTGGDTAVSVCQALGITGIQIFEEVAPAIPLGKMRTAEGKDLWVITKAGAFGSPDALVKASQKLITRKMRQ